MFNIGFSEFVIIGILALIFIGPKQLPDLARAIGRMMSDFQRATDDVKKSLIEVRDESINPITEIRDELRKDLHTTSQGFHNYMDDIKHTTMSEVSAPKEAPEQLELIENSAEETKKQT